MIDTESVRRIIAPYYINFSGWRTRRKIIVIESDDWGSIRMPSLETFHTCLSAGYRVDLNNYEKYDSLASEEDLEYLFELLASYKDQHDNHPVFTANVLSANPDFKKIQESGFTEYHYEPITETFKSYPKHKKVFGLWLTGMQKGLFFPQSHGREHLNVSMFMDALKVGDSDAHFGFRHQMPGCINRGGMEKGNKYVEVLRYNNGKDKKQKLEIILDGLKMFEDLFDVRSKSFMPPNYIWSPDFDETIAAKGISYYQGSHVMKEPLNENDFCTHKYKLGDFNEFGQYYLVRNAYFEPSLSQSNEKDPVTECLREISVAFRMKKPAVICSHRINYVGYINENNRDENLKYLKKLLDTIVEKWPDVEFMTSVQLGELIKNDIVSG